REDSADRHPAPQRRQPRQKQFAIFQIACSYLAGSAAAQRHSVVAHGLFNRLPRGRGPMRLHMNGMRRRRSENNKQEHHAERYMNETNHGWEPQRNLMRARSSFV